MKRIVLIVSLWAVAQGMQGQSRPVRFQHELPPQEKVYVQMDNDAYVQGDTVWYKAYVVRADNYQPAFLSRILYVELLDEQGYLQERQQLVINSRGQARGQFVLRRDAFPGHYEIRAYTRWMMNFHDGPFMVRQKLASLSFGSSMQDDNVVRDASVRDQYVLEVSNERGAFGSKSSTEKTPTTDFYSDFETVLRTCKQQNGLFSRVFSVYQRPKTDNQYMVRVMPVKNTMGDVKKIFLDKELNVRFFPEGGHLVEGVCNRMGWEIYDKEGRRLSMEGELKAGGDVIGEVKTLYAGRGTFLFVPVQGKTYSLGFRANDKSYTFTLPEAETEGCAMQITQFGGHVTIRLRKHFDKERTLRLSLTSRGRLVNDAPLSFQEDSCTVQFDVEQLPLGVNQATVYDESENIISDRLFFVRNAQEKHVMMNVDVHLTDKRVRKPFERERLKLLLTDSEGNPANHQTVSLSVRDAEQLDQTFSRGNILTHLLLQSDMKGFVENPEYYFSQDSCASQALDLLLMIQGWRRYKWTEVAHAERFKPAFLPEQTTNFSGEVWRIRHKITGNKRKPIQLHCSLRMTDYRTGQPQIFTGTMQPDSAGHFTFAYPPFYGTGRLSVRATTLGKKNNAQEPHDRNLFIRRDTFYPLNLKAYSWYEVNSPLLPEKSVGGVRQDKSTDYPGFILPDVAVKSYKRPHAQRQKDRPEMKISFLDFQNHLWDIGWYDSEYLFDNREQNLDYFYHRVREFVNWQYPVDWFAEKTEIICNWKNGRYARDNQLTPQSILFYKNLDSIAVITDNPRRPSRIVNWHLDRHRPIESNTDLNTDNPSTTLSMVRNTDTGMDGTFGYAAYLNVLGSGEKDTFPVYGREWNLKGFTRPAEFYSPNYDSAKINQRDHRRTLYWNPSVTTNAYGEAEVEFYNSATCSGFDVEVEGVTDDGRFIVGRVHE